MDDQLISKTVSRNLKFLSARKLDSSLLEKTRPYQRTVRCGFLLALAFFALASSALAQPTMSRGEQLLPISYNECMRRAEQAYIAEGWVNIGKGGAFVSAFKENNGAYITCNVAPENKTWANIFVASNSGDGGVPGGQRVCLQKQMEQPGASKCGNAGNDQFTTWTWAVGAPGQSLEVHGAVTLWANGRAKWSGDGREGMWSRAGDRVVINWPQNNSVDTLTLSSDERVMTGANKDGWNIRATRQ
jgi:hypothetical protein